MVFNMFVVWDVHTRLTISTYVSAEEGHYNLRRGDVKCTLLYN